MNSGTKKFFDGSTKTYYFETFIDEEKLISLLNKYLEAGDLCYYRYSTYSIIGERIKKWDKIIGILQFDKRLAKTVLRRKFVSDNVFMDVLQPAVKPVVLLHMKMYVIGEFHGLLWSDTKSSDTPFGFGGKKTKNEGRYMKPYMKALTLYEDYDKPDFPYKDLHGAKRICKFKYRLHKGLINI